MNRVLGWAGVLAASFVLTSVVAASDTSDELRAIADFLRQNVAGRSVTSESVVKIDEGRMEVDFRRETKVTNLLVGERQIQFDIVSIIKQTNFDLNKEGQRVGNGVNRDRTSTNRVVVRVLRSTGEVAGLSYMLTSSLDEGTLGGGSFARLSVEDGNFVMRTSTAGYTDLFAQGGKFKPGASEEKTIYSLADKKLRVEHHYQLFNVDPETMVRTPREKPLTIVATEN